MDSCKFLLHISRCDQMDMRCCGKLLTVLQRVVLLVYVFHFTNHWRQTSFKFANDAQKERSRTPNLIYAIRSKANKSHVGFCWQVLSTVKFSGLVSITLLSHRCHKHGRYRWLVENIRNLRLTLCYGIFLRNDQNHLDSISLRRNLSVLFV